MNTRFLSRRAPAAAVCAALLFAACAKQKEGGIPVRVALDWTPNTNHSGIYAALENGWFAEAGFTVSILQPPEDGALVLLAAGGAEYAVDFQETLGLATGKKEGALPLTAVAAIVGHNTSGIMSLAESGIDRPRALAGKRFASWETPLVTAIVKNVVEADGGNFGRVTMVPNYATDALSALNTDIDAIWVYYAWDGIAAACAGVKTNYLDFGTLNPVFDFYTPVLVTRDDYAASRKDEVTRFMAALSKGYAFAIARPEAAADILLKHAPELSPRLVRESQAYLSPRYRADAPRWGEIDAGRWSAFYRWMYAEGVLETDLGERGFTNEYLPESGAADYEP